MGPFSAGIDKLKGDVGEEFFDAVAPISASRENKLAARRRSLESSAAMLRATAIYLCIACL